MIELLPKALKNLPLPLCTILSQNTTTTSYTLWVRLIGVLGYKSRVPSNKGINYKCAQIVSQQTRQDHHKKAQPKYQTTLVMEHTNRPLFFCQRLAEFTPGVLTHSNSTGNILNKAKQLQRKHRSVYFHNHTCMKRDLVSASQFFLTKVYLSVNSLRTFFFSFKINSSLIRYMDKKS